MPPTGKVEAERHMMPDNRAAQRRLDEIQGQMPQLVTALLGCQPYSRDRRPAVPKRGGVYLFSETGTHRYVGRTRDFNRRFGEHVAPGSLQNKAAFAFRIARAEAARDGLLLPGTREQVQALPEFAPFFAAAKGRVRRMEFRIVEINDPAVSTVFEVYASIAMRTEGEFNLFETH
jgi:hypothetical protein